LAGDRIKGITVEIGGDTQGLDKALKGVNAQSSKLQRELNDVQRLLKFDPNSVELMAQKQQLLNDQIENTEKKLQTLKDAQAQVQKQFDQGDIGVEQYRAFQRELQDTESYLRNTKNAVADLNAEQDNIKKSTQEMSRLFEVTGTSLEDFADVLGNRTVRAIQQGTASSRDLQKAFERISRETVGTSADINEVRQSLQRLEQGESSIRNVRRELQRMGDDADDTKGSVKDLGGELGGLVAGAGAGMGIGAIFEKSMDISDLDTVIEISMEIPDESKQAVKDAIKTVGGYIQDNETALEGVRKQFQLNANLTDEENQRIVKGAGVISKAYAQVDFTELIQETYEMGKSMGLTQEQALGMTKALLDMGFPPEQLDIISEYGTQLSRAGYTAEEIQGIFASGIETGTWNIDNLMDGLKEGRILLSEFGAEVPKAIQESLKGTEISAQQVQAWGQAMAQGGDVGKQAMMDVAIALSQVQDETKRNELGVAFFGTMWEEQGSKITDTIIGAKDLTGDLAENQRQLNTDVASLDASPQQQLNQALQSLWTTLTPLMVSVANFVTKVAEWIQQNPTLTATILAVVSVIGILIGIFLVLSPIIIAVTGLAGALGVSVGAVALPILIVIGVIASLIAIGVLLYRNWDTIVASAKKLGKSISENFRNMVEGAKKWMNNLLKDVKRIWGNVMDFFEGIDLKQTGKDIIQGLINGIKSMANKVKETARNIANGIGEKIKSILKLGSPSKLMESYGEFTGEGLAIGMKNSLGMIKNMAEKMSKNAIPDLSMDVNQGNNNVATTPAGKNLTVNIHSPKALDVRQASRELNRTLNKMSLMW
jgi:phage-related minor tail protein